MSVELLAKLPACGPEFQRLWTTALPGGQWGEGTPWWEPGAVVLLCVGGRYVAPPRSLPCSGPGGPTPSHRGCQGLALSASADARLPLTSLVPSPSGLF